MTKEEKQDLIDNTRYKIYKLTNRVNKSKKLTKILNRRLKLAKEELYKLVENL